MDDQHDLTDDEFNNFDWRRWHYEGKHFEARAVSRSEFEALKRFGDYEELPNSILMRALKVIKSFESTAMTSRNGRLAL